MTAPRVSHTKEVPGGVLTTLAYGWARHLTSIPRHLFDWRSCSSVLSSVASDGSRHRHLPEEELGVDGAERRSRLSSASRRLANSRADVDEMAVGIAERHGPVSPWLGGRRQNPFDPDPVDAGIRLVDVSG